MKWIQIIFTLVILLSRISESLSYENDSIWQSLEQGLSLGIFQAPQPSEFGDSRIAILRINPDYYDAELFCASEYGKKSRSAEEWSREFNLVAVINGGMYATDYLTSVGYFKSGNHINNPSIHPKHNCIFATGALSPDVPPWQIIDLQCQDFSLLKTKYRSFLQSIRMISCRQKNVWQPQTQKWSIAALGTDKRGNLLFIHCRSPYSVHDFINMLLELPLDIDRAMYLEGGPPASLYINSGKIKSEWSGGYQAEIYLNQNHTVRTLPNVIGIRRRIK
ncbi:MAG: phosphodiester glycosidase family protein [Calditrichia bacterium]